MFPPLSTAEARQDKFSKMSIAYATVVNKTSKVMYKLFSEEEKFYGAKSKFGLLGPLYDQQLKL